MNCTGNETNGTCFNSTGSGTFNAMPGLQKNSSDGPLAIAVLVVALVIAGFIVSYLWKQNSSDFNPESSSASSEFRPPKERASFYEYKEQLEARAGAPDGTVPVSQEDVKQLSKLLMHRAVATIPLYHKVHSEFGSTERLYKKGMLTEEVYNRLKRLNDYVNSEIKAVMEEAEDLLPGWGKAIWPKANDVQMSLARLAQLKGGAGDGDDEADEEDGEEGDNGGWEDDDDDAEEVEMSPVVAKRPEQKPKPQPQQQQQPQQQPQQQQQVKAAAPSSSSSSSKAATPSAAGAATEQAKAPPPSAAGNVTTEEERKRAERELLAEADLEEAQRDKLKKGGSPSKKKK